jgi:hypothetical protein
VIDPWPHPACLPDEELLKHCTVGRGRSSGPGGQHRNKVETEVIITHDPTDTRAHAGERRSQIENKRVAVFRLRLLLASNLRTPVPLGEIGSALWRSRVRSGKIAVNPEHQDFPSMLAEAMDVIAAAAWDPKKASLRLGCSASQLIKLIKDHPPSFERWNRGRAAHNLHPLK